MDLDLITLGRSSIDLYSADVGKPFPEITAFSAFVGGCPTNIAVGARRLGLKTALLTAVGDDPVGDFVLNFLNKEKVLTQFIPRKGKARTSAVVLGIQPPDHFPLVFYRENCADWHLSIDDVEKAPIDRAKILLVTGTALSREPSASATLYAVEKARRSGIKVALDLDFRADQWADPRSYGLQIRGLLSRVDWVIGTEEELKAACLQTGWSFKIEGGQISSPKVEGSLQEAIQGLFAHSGPEVLALKKGAHGSEAHFRDGKKVAAAPYKVEVLNVLGAGDAFAAGFLFAKVQGWDWNKALQWGNACGAILVTQPGCSNFMPTRQEVERLMKT
jgi:5-dehydro-2-deoxygluconokinase